ncbi:MAG: AzlC family ABC transporter permease [Treponema sp.]|nr:AzlC family ABC transporter permease [Treponema sp.]
MYNNKILLKSLNLTLPIFFGYISIGIPFGLMVVNAGYPWWMALVMSLTIFSGTGQYIAVSLMAAGTSLTTFLITQFFVGIRHIVYGLSLLNKFKGIGKWKLFLIFALTDETYAILSTTEAPEDADKGKFFSTVAALDWSYWVLGSLIGALIGTWIPFSFDGVEFALNSLFVVLMINQIKSSKDIFPSLCGIIICLVAIILSKFNILPAQHILIVALSLGIAVLLFVRGIFGKNKDSLNNNSESKNK